MNFLQLFLGTIIHRPYVYAFFACYTIFALRHLRLRGYVAWTVLAYLIAFQCEYSSTRNGFPFGIYRYFDEMRTQELWIFNVPFWDSLSFVFLSYFSWLLSAQLLNRSGRFVSTLMRPQTAVLAGVLMMLLDIVIDPLTLLGDRWFLGRIYDYPTGGTYFGVTLANFWGWFFVGSIIPLTYQFLSRTRFFSFSRWNTPTLLDQWGVFGVYAGVFLFNLGITVWIREWTLFAASSIVVLATLSSCLWVLRWNR